MPQREPAEDPDVAAAYDELADSYADVAESAPHNAHLEFPATTDLIPDVDGERVLDAGCGAGRYVEWLLEHDASVVGVDASAAMVEQTRERVDGDAEVHQVDLADSLAFADDDAYDGVVSSLALDYVEDWRPLFGEFARVLRPGGFLVFSVAHPMNEFTREEASSYFDVELREPDFETGVPFYRRPLGAMVGPLLDAGFRLDDLVEPQPTEAFREAAPAEYEEASREPTYLCVRAVLA